MKVKQSIHRGTDPVTDMINSGLYDYEGFEGDKKQFIDSYKQWGWFSSKHYFRKILEKQKVSNGDRSHPILTIKDKSHRKKGSFRGSCNLKSRNDKMKRDSSGDLCHLFRTTKINCFCFLWTCSIMSRKC